MFSVAARRVCTGGLSGLNMLRKCLKAFTCVRCQINPEWLLFISNAIFGLFLFKSIPSYKNQVMQVKCFGYYNHLFNYLICLCIWFISQWYNLHFIALDAGSNYCNCLNSLQFGSLWNTRWVVHPSLHVCMSAQAFSLHSTAWLSAMWLNRVPQELSSRRSPMSFKPLLCFAIFCSQNVCVQVWSKWGTSTYY